MIETESLFQTFGAFEANLNRSKMRATILSLVFVLCFSNVVWSSCHVSKIVQIFGAELEKKQDISQSIRMHLISNVCTTWSLERKSRLRRLQAMKNMVGFFLFLSIF